MEVKAYNRGRALQTHLYFYAPLTLLDLRVMFSNVWCFAAPELIEALRQQLKQEQYMAQQQGIRGRCAFSPRHVMEDLGEAGSDDDCRDENENPDFGVREVGANDRHFLGRAGGRAGYTW